MYCILKTGVLDSSLSKISNARTYKFQWWRRSPGFSPRASFFMITWNTGAFLWFVKGGNVLEIQKKMGKNWSKQIPVTALCFMSLFIVFLGVFFSTYSVLNHITFTIIQTKVSGLVFGLMVCYLGIRNYLSVLDLKEKMKDSNITFSWSNFKMLKKSKKKVKA